MSDALFSRLDEATERLDDHEKRLQMHDSRLAAQDARLAAHDERFDATELAMFGGFDAAAKAHHVGVIEQLRIDIKSGLAQVATGVTYIGTIKKTVIYTYRGLVGLVTAVAIGIGWCVYHLPQLIHFLKAL